MGAIRTVHAWAGAALAVLAIVFGLTGSLLVFEDDWIRASVPAARAPVDLDTARLGAALEAIEAAEPRVKTVVLPAGVVGAHRLYLPDEGFAYADAGGAVVERWRGAARAETFVFDLHHELLAGHAGKLVAGGAGLALVLMVLTGMIVWIPAWRATGWRMWPRSGARRELIGSHRNLGLIFTLPLLLFSLTGAAIVFHGTTQALLNGGPPPTPPAPAVSQGDIDWTAALTAARARFPDAAPRMVSWPAAPGKPATLRMRQPGEWHPNGRTTVTIDPATSEVVAAMDANRLGDGLRVYNALYPVHAASVGGWLYELVTVLSGLAMAGLGGVGLWAFLGHRFGRTGLAARRRPLPQTL
ncbi:PepSY-associated TM helix domain-containing protein [Brevundimonas sp.]|uniref:PepSY-associated TM helix domain-containing protein n=1 Tax=Brevundimonas sp. TaxID=1871086 RepID=UPI002D27CD02|nr:PepSY-associated TM helix domain-containing protein [Brevundimonas sp.]HYC99491.1 PepSY-associated TM helix domain-containing protein [Brevundimonas sp.]